MLYTEHIVTVSKGTATIDEPVILYKGDYEVGVRIDIKGNPFKSVSGGDTITTGKLLVKREDGEYYLLSSTAITRNNVNKLQFIIPKDKLDDEFEAKAYDFQIRLLGNNSRATLPEVTGGLIVKFPLCEESGSTDEGTAGDSNAGSGTVLDVFDDNGEYIVTEWKNGDIISSAKLNKVESALDTLSHRTNEIGEGFDTLDSDIKKVKTDVNLIKGDYAKKSDIPTVPSLDGYATETYVNEAIANASLGGEEVDLTGYVTQDYLNMMGYVTYGNLPDFNQFATNDYVNEQLGNISALLDEINGEVI